MRTWDDEMRPRAGIEFIPIIDVMMFLLVCTLWAAAAHAEGVAVRLIAVNDFHGHLEAGNNINNTLLLPDLDIPGKTMRVAAGGAASLAGLVGQLRTEMPNTLFFSVGDMIGAAPLVSTLFRHEPTIEAMNASGLDFAIVGNHELDGGTDELRRLMRGGCAPNVGGAAATSCALGEYRGAGFPLLAANILGKNGQPIFPATLVREFGGIKIGFIGVVTRTTPAIVTASRIAGLHFSAEADTLNRYAAELKRQGVAAIVAVVHEGGFVGTDWNDPACAGAEGEIFKIAEQLTRDIGLVFSAHTHQGYNCILNTPRQQGLRVIQATSYGRGVAVVDVVLDPGTRDFDRSRTVSRNIAVVSRTQGKYLAVPQDAKVAQLVSTYAARAAPSTNRTVGSVATRIERGAQDRADFPIGRLIADAQLAATQAPVAGGARIALMNANGIRATLPCETAPPCPVSYGQAFALHPFGNNLVVMTLTGRQIKALLEEQQLPQVKEPRFLQPSHGFTYVWRRSAPYGERVSDLRLSGLPLQPDAPYRIAVNSFLAEGGDGFQTLKAGSDRIGSALDIDALLDFLRTNPAYAPDTRQRIKLVD